MPESEEDEAIINAAMEAIQPQYPNHTVEELRQLFDETYDRLVAEEGTREDLWPEGVKDFVAEVRARDEGRQRAVDYVHELFQRRGYERYSDDGPWRDFGENALRLIDAQHAERKLLVEALEYLAPDSTH